MKRSLSSNEFEILKKELADLGYNKLSAALRIEEVFINGVTFLEASDSPDGKIITYAEDDLKDENGFQYVFDYPYYKIFGELTPGKRLIAVYAGRNYLVIPISGESFTLVGAVNPDEKYDKGRSVKLPTPKVLELPKDEARAINENDVMKIKQTIKAHKGYAAASIVGTIAMSLLFIIVIGVIYIFLFSALEDAGDSAMIACTVIAGVLIIAGIAFSIVFFKNIYLRNVKKMKYIKQVMVTGIDKEPLQNNVKTIGIYEWVGNELVFKSFTLGIGQLFLPDDLSYGDIIYMLTKEKNKKNDVFSTRIFMSKEWR